MAFDREIVALTVYCEASGEAPPVRRAVVWVIRNRLAAGRFGKTLAEICLKREQFSEYDDDPRDNEDLLRGARIDEDDSVMADCLKAFDEIVGSSEVLDPTLGATHYYDISIPEPYWAKQPGAVNTLISGKLMFYKGVE